MMTKIVLMLCNIIVVCALIKYKQVLISVSYLTMIACLIFHWGFRVGHL